jgi:hypothetical protein
MNVVYMVADKNLVKRIFGRQKANNVLETRRIWQKEYHGYEYRLL